MLSPVKQLELARDYFARAPARGALTEAAERHQTSRPTTYEVVERLGVALRRRGPSDELRRLREEARQRDEQLRNAYHQIGNLRRRLKPDWDQIHRFIVEAAVAPVSLDNTVGLVERAFNVEVSSEYVRGVVNRASARAHEALDRLAAERKARRAVGDEIFLGERPMLVVAEPQSLAVLRVSVEAHRDQDHRVPKQRVFRCVHKSHPPFARRCTGFSRPGRRPRCVGGPGVRGGGNCGGHASAGVAARADARQAGDFGSTRDGSKNGRDQRG